MKKTGTIVLAVSLAMAATQARADSFASAESALQDARAAAINELSGITDQDCAQLSGLKGACKNAIKDKSALLSTLGSMGFSIVPDKTQTPIVHFQLAGNVDVSLPLKDLDLTDPHAVIQTVLFAATDGAKKKSNSGIALAIDSAWQMKNPEKAPADPKAAIHGIVSVDGSQIVNGTAPAD